MGFDVSKDRFGYAGGFEAMSGSAAAPGLPIAPIAITGGASLNSSPLITPPIDTTGGTFIAIFVGSFESHAVISDSKGNVYQPLTVRGTGGFPPYAGQGYSSQMHYCIGPTVGSGHTFTASNLGTYGVNMCVLVFNDDMASFDQETSGFAADGASACPCGSITPAETKELFIAGLCGDASYMPPNSINSGFTIGRNESGAFYGAVSVAYKKHSALTAQAPIWKTALTSGGRGLGGSLAAFKTHDRAQEFIQAAGITDATQQNAIKTLVTDLKTAGIWSKCQAIYPMVGGNATAHKFNLKDPRDLDAAFRLTFAGGWTHSATGALPDGSSGYADTHYVRATSGVNNSTHTAVYSRTNSASGLDLYVSTGLGASGIGISFNLLSNNCVSDAYEGSSGANRAAAPVSDSRGFFAETRTNATTHKLFQNGVQIGATDGSTSTGFAGLGISMFLGAANNSSSIQYVCNHEYAFASIGSGLSDADAAAFNTAVQKFQTTLGRAIIPISLVADVEASSNAATATTGPIDTTGANLIVVATSNDSVALTDSKSNVWLSAVAAGANSGVKLWYCSNPTVGSGHTFTATGVVAPITVEAFKTVAASSPLDTQSAANGTNPGSVTPSQNDCLIVSAALSAGSLVTPAGYTETANLPLLASQSYAIAMAYKTQASAGAENPTWTGATQAAIAAFKHA